MSLAQHALSFDESAHISEWFAGVTIDSSWAFADKTRKETAYITHGYHRYPAKFIPQLAARLMATYTQEQDLIVDTFAGCGTTLIEAKMMNRPSVGVDINPVAVLIAKAKTTPIAPALINQHFVALSEALDSYHSNASVKLPTHERIAYWFSPDSTHKLAFLLSHIAKIKHHAARDFFYCGFSNILKSCSIWMQKSNKPTRDFNKIPAEPFACFLKQAKMMMRNNEAFFNALSEKGLLKVSCGIHCQDARKIPVAANAASLVVTSPPYVTSYEYADLHQLSALWLGYMDELGDFRKQFIGTASAKAAAIDLNSSIALSIADDLHKVHKKTAEEVATYFSEMNATFKEMRRVLKAGGKACIVIGNTSLKGVQILNAEVFVEQFVNLGFEVEEIIKREIPSKTLPSTRDKATGRFSKTVHKGKVYAYPTEYILVMKKV